MGTPISSTMAEVYLQYIEEIHMKQWLGSTEIIYYKRFVDDIIIIYDQSKTQDRIILHEINKIDKNLQFKISTEESNTINYLDVTIHRNNNNMDIRIYRKTTGTDTTIQFSSNHPHQHKIVAFRYYINRMITLPITEKSRKGEWKTILALAKNNGYPIHVINNLKEKLTTKKQKHQRHQQHPIINQHKKKWVTFTYFSPIIKCNNNMFKHSNLNIAFRATNTIQQQLSKEYINNKNPSGIYKRKCNTSNKVYVGQSGTSMNVWLGGGEYVRYIRTKNPQSAYALHILQNRHE